MDSIARGVAAAACTILEHLGQTFRGAKVDYESLDGLHNFIIEQDGTRFRVQFNDQALLRKSSYEIEETIHKVVEQVLCATSPRVTLFASPRRQRYPTTPVA
jgi:hypothetical protein